MQNRIVSKGWMVFGSLLMAGGITNYLMMTCYAASSDCSEYEYVVPCECKISPAVYKLLCPKRSPLTLKKLPLDVKFDFILKKSNVVPIVILGSGPAGLSAALYGARGRIRTLVIAGEKPGGQLMETTRIENWPGKRNVLASEAIQELKEQALSFGAEFLTGSIDRVDFSKWPYKLYTDVGKEINALSVIITTGASPRRLGVPGEKDFWGAGVSGCAICDAPFFKGKRVAICGGGDVAIEEASILAPYASTVTILVRKENMKAAAAMQKRLDKLSNVKVLYNREVKKVLGNNEGVTGVVVMNGKTQQKEEITTDGVFLAIGHIPNTKLFSKSLELTSEGYIKLACRMQQTSLPGIFAAGDVADPRYKQAGKAAGDGIAAALDAIEFLNNVGLTSEISSQLNRLAFDIFEGEDAPVTAVETIDALVTDVISNKKTSVLFVGSADCVNCPAMHRAFKLSAHRFLGRVNFFEVDAGQAQELITDDRVKVLKVPCLLVYKDGKLWARNYDTMNKHELYDYVSQFLE